MNGFNKDSLAFGRRASTNQYPPFTGNTGLGGKAFKPDNKPLNLTGEKHPAG